MSGLKPRVLKGGVEGTAAATNDALERRESLAAIIESSDDAIFGTNLNGQIQSWNRGAEELFGYKAEEILERNISLLSAPGSLDDLPNILRKIATGERIDHFETQRLTKDGKLVSVSLTLSPLHASSGNVIGASMIARNVTKPKRQVQLQDHLAAIIESANDAVVSKDLNGIIQSWNHGAECLFGYKSSETIGKHISILAAGGSADEFPDILARVARGERIDDYQTTRRAKDGRIITVSLSVSPVRDSSGAIVGASKIIRNVTKYALDEAQVEKANAVLIHSNKNLLQFAYSASHDLQEPLRMMTLYTQMLQRDSGSTIGPLGEQYIAGVLAGASRMRQLLSDLRSYLNTSEEEQRPCGDVDSGEILDRVLVTLDAELKKSGAFVSRTELPRLCIHDFHLEQLLQNLVGNALKYRGQARPLIEVAAECREHEWLFSVRDNGIGIAPQFHQQVFQAFRRLHTSNETSGTGLGLAICQGIVDRLKGRIWVESEVGRKTTFFFTVPVAKNNAQAAATT